MKTKKQEIKNKILNLFYINGNISVNINDFITDYNKTTWLDKKLLITSIKNHQTNYNEVLLEIIKELEQKLKEFNDDK